MARWNFGTDGIRAGTPTKPCDFVESSLDKKVFDDVLKLLWGVGEKFSPDGLDQLVILLAFWLRCGVYNFTIFDRDLFPSIGQYFLHDKTVVLHHNTFW